MVLDDIQEAIKKLTILQHLGQGAAEDPVGLYYCVSCLFVCLSFF